MINLKTLAPAKVNLYLHVTGRRGDGYHLLDSLVAFADIGDELRLEAADGFVFSLTGPMAAVLRDEPVEGNLAVRAARALAKAVDKPLNVRLTLVKNLPPASGIGGGSSDAAAALRLLARHWGVAANDPLLYEIAASLGQDVPCCVDAKTCYFRDIGNAIDDGPELPPTAIVLVNPNKALPTPAVFKARTGGFNPPNRFERAPRSSRELAAMLSERENGLTAAAAGIMPEIHEILSALDASPDCLLARMSGSGATCFGLYQDNASAQLATAGILAAHPDWWVFGGEIPCSAIPSP